MTLLEHQKMIIEFEEVPTMSNKNGTVYCPIDPYTGETLFILSPNEFKYDTSWDWLMPAWVKLRRALLELKDGGNKGALLIYEDIVPAIASGDISLAYGKVVAGIKWINDNK